MSCFVGGVFVGKVDFGDNAAECDLKGKNFYLFPALHFYSKLCPVPP